MNFFHIFVKIQIQKTSMDSLIDSIGKYNTWQNNRPDPGFIRQGYLKRLENFVGNNLVKVMTGQRRAGKSYLMRQVMLFLIENLKVNPKNIFYLNKEYLEYDAIKGYEDLTKLVSSYKNRFKPKGKIYLFLDEIQNISGWEKFVNAAAQDFVDKYEVFISGSNSKLLSGELATLLSGRYVRFEIFPFGMEEYAGYYKLPVNRDTFLKYLRASGLPETFHLRQTEIVSNYIKSLRDTIVLRDIIERNRVKDPVLLDEIFNYLIMNTGNVTSIPNIVKYFKSKNKKTNYETISAYAGYLLDTFVVHESVRYNIRGKQLLGGVRKYYLNDLGFKNFLFGIFPENMGYNLENFVFLELKRKGYTVNTGVLNNKEIDFIATKNDKTIYIQVAYLLNTPGAIEREYGNLLAINDNFEKYIVSLDEIRYSNKNGIIHLFPWQIKDI